MAGTLTIQNLQGPTSGANANKVIIPSGQTIDASAGTLVPSAGQVVQVVRDYDEQIGHTSTTSTSLVASGLTSSITPVYSDSLIFVDFSVTMTHANSSATLYSTMYIKVGSGSMAAMSGAGNFHCAYSTTSQYPPVNFRGSYTATSTDTITFEPYFKTGAAGTVYLTHSGASYAFTLTEVKQ